jgi:hypothetical protein
VRLEKFAAAMRAISPCSGSKGLTDILYWESRTMATIDEIMAKQKAAVPILVGQILMRLGKKSGRAPALDDAIHDLMTQHSCRTCFAQ